MGSHVTGIEAGAQSAARHDRRAHLSISRTVFTCVPVCVCVCTCYYFLRGPDDISPRSCPVVRYREDGRPLGYACQAPHNDTGS